MRHRGQRAGVILLSVGLLSAAVAAPALAAAHHKGTKVATTKISKLGRVLASPKGQVMYLLTKDKHGVSHCSGACASAWPKVTSKTKPRAGAGIKAKHLARNAKHQVTYYGHPLYYFVGDTKSHEATGEGEESFYVVSTHGKPIKPKKKPVKKTGGPTGPAEVTTGMAGSPSTEVLTSKDGHTLYALDMPDEKTSFSCTSSSCLSNWKPLLTKGAPTAAGDAEGSMLGTVTRSGIGTQVTYNGYPVYDFSGDSKAGQDNGEAQFGPAPYGPPSYQYQYWWDLTAAGTFHKTL